MGMLLFQRSSRSLCESNWRDCSLGAHPCEWAEKNISKLSRALNNEMLELRPNYLGIIGGILSFTSLALAWWTMSVSGSVMGTSFSAQASVYLYQVTATAIGSQTTSGTVSMNLWFGWIALAFVVIGAWLALAGSFAAWRRTVLLALGGILVVSSAIVFAAGLQNQISSGTWLTDFPAGIGVGLFSSGTYQLGYYGVVAHYSAYLSYGFWLVLIAGIMMFASLIVRLDGTNPSTSQSSPPIQFQSSAEAFSRYNRVRENNVKRT
jgi:hypothetical protein